MADKTIGELPVAPQLDDDSLLVVEQQGEARSIKGQLIRHFATVSVESYVEAAQTAAEQASESAQDAENSATEAAQSATDAAGSATKAEQYSGKPPQIQNGTWWIWNADTQEYEDTGEAVRGNVMYATFEIDPETGILYMITPNEYTGPVFYLVDGFLEVAIENE